MSKFGPIFALALLLLVGGYLYQAGHISPERLSSVLFELG